MYNLFRNLTTDDIFVTFSLLYELNVQRNIEHDSLEERFMRRVINWQRNVKYILLNICLPTTRGRNRGLKGFLFLLRILRIIFTFFSPSLWYNPFKATLMKKIEELYIPCAIFKLVAVSAFGLQIQKIIFKNVWQQPTSKEEVWFLFSSSD